MQKSLKLAAVIMFLTVGFFVFTSHETQVSAASANFAGEASPRSLYVSNCSRCHGTNGKSQTKEGKKTEADDLTSGDVKGISEAKMTRVITNGKGKMPAFGKKMTAAQISQVAGYVRGL